MDEILIWASTLSNLEHCLCAILEGYEKLHITFSHSKFQIDKRLKFAGCVVSDEGVQPDPDRVSALSSFPVPMDQTGIIPADYQYHTVALQQLTGKGRPFLWLPEHQLEFDTLKTILSGPLVVKYFDSSKDIILLTNASRLHGLGYALGHIDLDGSGKKHFKIVHCGSRGLTPSQQRYSTIELECLAIIWAIQKLSLIHI